MQRNLTERSQDVACYIYNFIAMKEFGFPMVKMAFEKGIPDYENVGVLSFFKSQLRKPDMVKLNKNNYLQILIAFLNDFGTVNKLSFKETVLKYLFEACVNDNDKHNEVFLLGSEKDELTLTKEEQEKIKKEFDTHTLDLQALIDKLSQKIKRKLKLEGRPNPKYIPDMEGAVELKNLGGKKRLTS